MKIGFQELLLIFIVALVVIGPDKLPYYAKKFGQAMAQFKKYTAEATKEIRENIVEPLEEAQRPLREAMEPLKEAMEPLNEINREVTGSIQEVKASFAEIKKPAKSSKTKMEKTSEKTDGADHSSAAEQTVPTMIQESTDSTQTETSIVTEAASKQSDFLPASDPAKLDSMESMSIKEELIKEEFIKENAAS